MICNLIKSVSKNWDPNTIHAMQPIPPNLGPGKPDCPHLTEGAKLREGELIGATGEAAWLAAPRFTRLIDKCLHDTSISTYPISIPQR